MANKKKQQKANPAPGPSRVEQAPVVKPVTEKASKPLSINDFWIQATIIALIGFLFYCNTFSNEIAFDDKIVITQNEYVQSGFAGIPKILTGEAYESFSKQQKIGNPLTGGRYRPLSIVTFAIEQQILGTAELINASGKDDAATIKTKQDKLISDMHFRHFDNVILYILAGIILLWMLRYIVFPGNPLAAFVACLLFMVHPIHTEVVANVKSRDEIMSLIFICLTFIHSFKYQETRQKKYLYFALGFYFLALLSKEYAVMLIGLLPLSFFIFRKYDLQKSVMVILPFLAPLAIYFLLRFSSVSATAAGAEDEIMNNPYLYATGVQAIATKFFVMALYLKLLIFPHPLSADYSYAQIPYTDFSNAIVLVSLGIYAALVAAMAFLIMKRNIIGFALAFYFAFFVLTCNLFLNVGAPMGERFLFHPTVGFAIIIAWGLQQLYDKFHQSKSVLYTITAVLGIVVLASGFKTIERNKDWVSDATLFLHDVNTVPNSIIANCNAGAACLDKEEEAKDTLEKVKWLQQGLPYLNKAITYHKKYMLAYINRGIIYFKLHEYEKALSDCDSVRKYFPTHPTLPYLSYSLSDYYFKLGLENGRANNPDGAVFYFRKAIEAMPTDADLWYNLGYAYFSQKQYDEARKAFINALRVKPGHPQARNMLEQLKHL